MSQVKNRPALFEALGEQFVDAFGNVTVVCVVDGVEQPEISGSFRQVREIDMIAESGMSMEGISHKLSLAGSDVPADFNPDRDTLIVSGFDSPFQVHHMADDGRAMMTFYLRGDDG